MTAKLTDQLCTQCGMCCRGVLFGDVDLTAREVHTIESLGLDVEMDGEAAGVLLHPCQALEGRRCSIYAHRPRSCRDFKCDLLQRAERGDIEVDQAARIIDETLKHVEKVERLVGSLTPGGERLSLKERFAAENTRLSGGDRSARARGRKLEAAMRSLEDVIESTFMGRTRRS